MQGNTGWQDRRKAKKDRDDEDEDDDHDFSHYSLMNALLFGTELLVFSFIVSKMKHISTLTPCPEIDELTLGLCLRKTHLSSDLTKQSELLFLLGLETDLTNWAASPPSLIRTSCSSPSSESSSASLTE